LAVSTVLEGHCPGFSSKQQNFTPFFRAISHIKKGAICLDGFSLPLYNLYKCKNISQGYYREKSIKYADFIAKWVHFIPRSDIFGRACPGFGRGARKNFASSAWEIFHGVP
jgi:hypothetical protein